MPAGVLGDGLEMLDDVLALVRAERRARGYRTAPSCGRAGSGDDVRGVFPPIAQAVMMVSWAAEYPGAERMTVRAGLLRPRGEGLAENVVAFQRQVSACSSMGVVTPSLASRPHSARNCPAGIAIGGRRPLSHPWASCP